MNWRTGGWLRLVVRILGLTTLMLIIGTLAAPAQDPTKSAQAKKEEPKKEEPKQPPVKFGLSVNDPRALQGYTLISPFDSTKSFLLDMQGRVVNSWEGGCTPALSAILLENGHLVRPGSIGNDAQVFGPGPGVGGRIQEFTWEGEVVWDFKFYSPRQLPHHNMIRLPNGNMLLIVWDRKTTEEAIAAGRRPEMVGDRHLLIDSLIEIKPTGKTTGQVVWEWHLWDHLVQEFDKTKPNYGKVAEHPELVNLNYGEEEFQPKTAAKDTKDKPSPAGNPPANQPPRPNPDYTHFNGVAYNPELDQIVVSVWTFSEFWIIDHSTTTAEAAGHRGGRSGKGGDLLYRWGNPRAYHAGTKADRKLFSQHNAHWIPKGLPGAGHLLVFNNGRDRPGGNYSSVDELVLPVDSQGHYTLKPGSAYGPDGPVWSYTAPKKSDFYSSFISGAQRLANGNTLICSGANGTVFEVTPEKEIVWKYVNPVKATKPLGPHPQPGKIMTQIAGEVLGISAEQRKQFDEIQKDIDAHLDKLLTAEQKKQLAEGPQGPGGFFNQPGRVLPDQEQNRIKLTDEQKKDLASLQKAVDGRFDKVLTEAQRKQIKTVFTPPGPPPAGPPTGPQAGKILSASQQDALKLSPAQKKRLEEIQKEIDARLDTLLTEEQKRQLQTMQGPSFAMGPGGPPGGGPPGGQPLFRATRYAATFPAFAGKVLTPGKTLEELQPKEPEKKPAEKK